MSMFWRDEKQWNERMKRKTGQTTEQLNNMNFLTFPKTKQYKVTPMAHTSKAWKTWSQWMTVDEPVDDIWGQLTNWQKKSLIIIYSIVLFLVIIYQCPTFPLKLCSCSVIISGAMKAGVPAVLDSSASVPSNSLLTPKSAIFRCPSSPSRRLEGLMSLWTILW